MERLYHSQAPIPSTAGTTPLPDELAKQPPTTGIEQLGKPLEEQFMKLHRINVARQVAHAAAQYNMAKTKFMQRMENADPNEVDFEKEYDKFQAEVQGVTKGMNNDALAEFSPRMEVYNSHTYSSLKAQEIRNSASMAKAEIPELMRMSIQARLNATTAEEKNAAHLEFVQYIQSIELAPGEKEALKQQYAHDFEVSKIKRTSRLNPKDSFDLIENSRFLDEEEKNVLFREAAAQGNRREQTVGAIRDHNNRVDAHTIYDSLFPKDGTGGDLTNVQVQPENEPLVDAINGGVAQGIASTNDRTNPDYIQTQQTLRRGNVVDEYSLVEMFPALGREQQKELWELNEANKSMVNTPGYKGTLSHIDNVFDQVEKRVEGQVDQKYKAAMYDVVSQQKEMAFDKARELFREGKTAGQVRDEINNLLSSDVYTEAGKYGPSDKTDAIIRGGKLGRLFLSKHYEFEDEFLEGGPEMHRTGLVRLLLAGEADNAEWLLDNMEL